MASVPNDGLEGRALPLLSNLSLFEKRRLANGESTVLIPNGHRMRVQTRRMGYRRSVGSREDARERMKRKVGLV